MKYEIDADLVKGIIEHLDGAYDDYFERSDGYCKSSEGHITIGWDLGNYWDRDDPHWKPKPFVEIYSYVFLGNGRTHEYTSFDAALEDVKDAHYEEMAHDYEKESQAWEDFFASRQ